MIRQINEFRRLQGASGDDDAPEGPPQDTLDVRIIAIFAILLAGLLGGLAPLLIKCFRNASHPATLILRALSAGVILALALIHVIPDGAGDLESAVDYPVASCCVVFGVLAMVIIENTSRTFLRGTGGGSCGHHHGPDPVEADGDEKHVHTPDGHSHSHSRNDLAGATTGAVCTHSEHIPIAADVPPSGPRATAYRHDEEQPHTHSCVAVNNAANWASNPAHAHVPGFPSKDNDNDALSTQVMAYMFELGCVIHSFLIGIALGVTVDDRNQAIALLVALIFHQGLEGVGLGSVVVKASFTMTKAVIMICTYSIMTPLGVAIGIGIADTYDPESKTALVVQGVLNSISGGLLLYISLVQMIAEDFTRSDVSKAGSWGLRLATYAALIFGAICMAIIAIWN